MGPWLDLEKAGELLYQAWAIIANVSEGDWKAQDPGWVQAAERHREQYHTWLNGVYLAPNDPLTEART